MPPDPYNCRRISEKKTAKTCEAEAQALLKSATEK
jgi:hypothetical protein